MKLNRRETHKRMTVIEKVGRILKRESLKEGYRFQSRHRQINKY